MTNPAGTDSWVVSPASAFGDISEPTDNSTFTRDSFEPVLDGVDGRSAWWYFPTILADGWYRFSLDGSTYSGDDVTAGVQVAVIDNYTYDTYVARSTFGQTGVLAYLYAGGDYSVSADTWGDITAEFVLAADVATDWAPEDAPAGSDMFADAPEIFVNTRSVAFDANEFTNEDGEHTDQFEALGPDMAHTAWWKFIPTVDGTYFVDTFGSTGGLVDSMLTVWQGDSLAELTLVGLSDDAYLAGDKMLSLVEAQMLGGFPYYIQASPTSDDGLDLLCVTVTGPPALEVPMLVPAITASLGVVGQRFKRSSR